MYSQVVLKFLFVILQHFWTYQIFLAAVFGIETPGEKIHWLFMELLTLFAKT